MHRSDVTGCGIEMMGTKNACTQGAKVRKKPGFESGRWNGLPSEVSSNEMHGLSGGEFWGAKS